MAACRVWSCNGRFVLGVLILPIKMFISCWEARLMVFSCSGAHCPNDLL